MISLKYHQGYYEINTSTYLKINNCHILMECVWCPQINRLFIQILKVNDR